MSISKDVVKQFLIEAAKVGFRLLLTGIGLKLMDKGLVTSTNWTMAITGLGVVAGSVVYSLLEKYKVIKFINDAITSEDDSTKQ